MLRTDVRRRALVYSRKTLESAVRRPRLASTAKRTIRELDRALTEAGTYGSSYFGADRDPYDRMGLSGYERYDRDTSNANAIALPIWRHFPVKKTLDVGCATGFVVEALGELGVDAWGTDLSYYAVEHPAKGAENRLQQGDLMKGLPFNDEEFELTTCLEVLEHIETDKISTVLREIRRVTAKYVVATIPSFGPNDNGPGGWYDIKVRPEKLDTYIAEGPDYKGPVPYDDLYRDANGDPIEGHVTIASFAWWTEQFESAGFIRCGNTELQMHTDLARYAMTEYWNLYVFRTPDTPEPTDDQQDPSAVAHWEKNFKLDQREKRTRDYERLNEVRKQKGMEPLSFPT